MSPESDLLADGYYSPDEIKDRLREGKFGVAWEGVIVQLCDRYITQYWSPLDIITNIEKKYRRVGEVAGIEMTNRTITPVEIFEYLANVEKMSEDILVPLGIKVDEQVRTRLVLSDFLADNMTVNLPILGKGGGLALPEREAIRIPYERLDGSTGELIVRDQCLNEGLVAADDNLELGSIGNVVVVGQRKGIAAAEENLFILNHVLSQLWTFRESGGYFDQWTDELPKLGIVYVNADLDTAVTDIVTGSTGGPGLVFWGTKTKVKPADYLAKEALMVHELRHLNIYRTYPGYPSILCREVGATASQGRYCQFRGDSFESLFVDNNLFAYLEYLQGNMSFLFLPNFQGLRVMPDSGGSLEFWTSVCEIFLGD